MFHRDAALGTGIPRAARLARLGMAALLAGVVCAAGVPRAGAAEVVEARDLRGLGQAARAERLPILLVVTQSFCSYCEKLEREILTPMILSGEYRHRVIIRELVSDAGNSVRDFDGRPVHAADIAARYGAWVTPTLLFLDDRGREIAPRIRGINTPELYGYYVDAAIDEARRRMRGHD